MHQIERFFRRYILSTVGILIAFFLVNFVLLYIFLSLTKLHNDSYNDFSVGEFAGHISYESGAYSLDEEGADMLEQSDAWAMILDNGGTVVWEQGLPSGFSRSYTVSDVAVFSRWYLNDFPVKVWTIQDGLLVAGFPPGSFSRYSLFLDISYIRLLLAGITAAFLANLFLMLYLFLRNIRRVERATKPILSGIRDLSAGKSVSLPEKGELAEISAGLNRAGKYMLLKDNTRAEWIRGVSHDIRTPLSMILGYASEIEETSDLPEETRKQAGIIRRQGERLKNLVADLNLTTRLEYSMQPMRVTSFSAVELARQCVSGFLNSGIGGQYILEFEEDTAGCPVVLSGDRALLERMLGNLILNSMTHNPAGCRITVSVGITETDTGSSACVFTVTDDGTGMDETRIRALNLDDSEGNKNSDADPPGSTSSMPESVGSGHGLGLRIVRQIAKAHKGSVCFSQTAPRGLTVRAVIPAS